MARIKEYWDTKGITIEKIKQCIEDRAELEKEINRVTGEYEETENELVQLESEIIQIRKEVFFIIFYFIFIYLLILV